LLSDALASLGKVDLTPAALCNELRFTRDTFRDVTGVSIPDSAPKLMDVIPFPKMA
jgi:hypothetical protein